LKHTPHSGDCFTHLMISNFTHFRLRLSAHSSCYLFTRASNGNGNRNTESTAHAHKCPRIQPYLWCCLSSMHVFFESVSAPVLSGTQLPRFPDQVRLFGGLFGLLNLEATEVSCKDCYRIQ